MFIQNSILNINKDTNFFKSELFKIWNSEEILGINIFENVKSSVIDDAIYFSHHRSCPVKLHESYNNVISSNSVYPKPEITCIIIAYNNVTFVSNICEQIKKFTKDIVILDNNSCFEPMKNFLGNCAHEVFYMRENHGHKVYELEKIKRIIGPVFVITDPDLSLPNSITKEAIKKFYDLSTLYKVRKIGLALDISGDDIREDIKYEGKSIKEWENKFWQNRVAGQETEMYWADIDTTFCLVNNNFYNWPYIRVAGEYLAKHLPWHKNWDSDLMEGEYESYMYANRSTNWSKK